MKKCLVMFITIMLLTIVLSMLIFGIMAESFSNESTVKQETVYLRTCFEEPKVTVSFTEATLEPFFDPEEVIETTENIIVETTPIETNYYDVTDEEREMLARLVFLEASICSSECQEAVVSVVFNRLKAGKWGKTLTDVVYYPKAFTPSRFINYTTANESAYKAVDNVLKYGPTVPEHVRYFCAGRDFNWYGYENYCVLDDVYFGYFVNWKNGAW